MHLSLRAPTPHQRSTTATTPGCARQRRRLRATGPPWSRRSSATTRLPGRPPSCTRAVTDRTPAGGSVAHAANITTTFYDTVTGLSRTTFKLRKTLTGVPAGATVVSYNATQGRHPQPDGGARGADQIHRDPDQRHQGRGRQRYHRTELELHHRPLTAATGLAIQNGTATREVTMREVTMKKTSLVRWNSFRTHLAQEVFFMSYPQLSTAPAKSLCLREIPAPAGQRSVKCSGRPTAGCPGRRRRCRVRGGEKP
jgi:hypothetical protein